MGKGLRFSGILALATLGGCASDPMGPRESGDPVQYPDQEDGRDGDPGNNRTVRCESDHGRRRHCDMDTRGVVILARRISNTPCIQGRNWDVDQYGVWVAGGCRAEFAMGGGDAQGGAGSEGSIVRCESEDGRWRHCDAPVVRGVQLQRNVSRTPCILGDNWGWDRSGVWVNHGCRGDFRVF